MMATLEDFARAFGSACAARGIELIFGGGGTGLMGAVADAALAGGGRVVGIIPRSLSGIGAPLARTDRTCRSRQHARAEAANVPPRRWLRGRCRAVSEPLRKPSKCSPGDSSASTTSRSFSQTIEGFGIHSCRCSTTSWPRVSPRPRHATSTRWPILLTGYSIAWQCARIRAAHPRQRLAAPPIRDRPGPPGRGALAGGRPSLLHGDRLGKVAGLVHIAAAQHRRVVGEELEGH